MKITVVGLGYVGISLSILLAQYFKVVAFDIDPQKINSINNRVSPINDKNIEKFLLTKKLDLIATLDAKVAYRNSDYIIIAVPTNYDSNTNQLDTSIIDRTLYIADKYSPKAVKIIKSTVPIGYTRTAQKKYNNVIFCPEFLCENSALQDNLYPSRIIMGVNIKNEQQIIYAKNFANILSKIAKNNAELQIIGSSEAEAVKLFSNTYLAMRVAFFNELDCFAEDQNLNTKQIIDGICLDPRIGKGYNNPSFGYGGYCLPKDSKQLLSQFNNIPNDIIKAVVLSNLSRKKYISSRICNRLIRHHKVVGVYRLIMKTNSDNFRNSSVQDIIMFLKQNNIKVIIYEPLIKDMCSFLSCEVNNNLANFKKICDIIIANRYSTELFDVKEKIYTRDIWQNN